MKKKPASEKLLCIKFQYLSTFPCRKLVVLRVKIPRLSILLGAYKNYNTSKLRFSHNFQVQMEGGVRIIHQFVYVLYTAKTYKIIYRYMSM